MYLSKRPQIPFHPSLLRLETPVSYSRRSSDPPWDPHRCLPSLRGFLAALSPLEFPCVRIPSLAAAVAPVDSWDLGRRGWWGSAAAAIRPVEMAGGKETIEVKFRLFDGTDIGPNKYDPSTTVAALKEFVLARWPQGEETRRLTVLHPLPSFFSLCARFRCLAYI